MTFVDNISHGKQRQAGVVVKWFRSPDDRLTDAEYVAKLRQSLETWERWKYWILLPHVGLLLAAIYVSVWAFLAVLNIPQQFNVAGIMGFVVGIMFGWITSMLVHKALHGLVSILKPWRTERILFKLIDGLTEKDVDSLTSNEQGTSMETVQREP